MKVIRSVLMGIMCIGMWGCSMHHHSVTNDRAQVENSRVFAAGYDQVFEALVTTLKDLDMPLAYVNRETGMVETDQTKADVKTYSAVPPQGRPEYEWKGVEYATVRALVNKEDPEKSRVTLEVKVRELNTATGDVVDLPSNGRLEDAILKKIDKKV